MSDEHTCHDNCPCHEGKEPMSDFIDARKPEIPDEAIEAAMRTENLQVSQWENARTTLAAALPALREQWEKETVARVRGEMRQDGHSIRAGYMYGFNKGIKAAIRAIRQEGDDE